MGRFQDYAIHELSFSSAEDYKEWFDRMCDSNCTSFFCRSSSAMEGSKVLLMRCNRCGEGTPKGEERIRGTKKVHLYCSAFANVHFNSDGTVNARACFGHIGHDLDPALLRWTDEQLEYLKFMIQEFSTEYIVQKMRKDYTSKDSKLYFITKKDLWNLMVRFHLTPGVRDTDDVTSLAMREAERNPEDGIRYFRAPEEPSGKGFVLVIITPIQRLWLEQFGKRGISVDDTHNVTRYALKLATVMVVDDRDRGLPAAFLLSGEMTSKEVKILFDEIRRLIPNFHPKSLVSDEALAFYNGFKLSFGGRIVDHFLCRFHILQSWKRKTKECVKPELQRGIIEAFRSLLKIADEPTFHAKLGEILTHLRLQGCSRLIQYLQREYLGPDKIKQWAAFHRRGIVMSTSMYTERWHLRLKQEKLKRKANSRIDYVVDTLIKSVEELAADLEIRDRRQLCSSFRVKENNIQHKLAVRFYKENSDRIHKVGNLAWNVDSTSSDTVYRVEFEEQCSCSEINTHCSRCHICPYAVTCSCRSGSLAGVACFHSHAVKLYGGEPTSEPPVIIELQAEPPVAEIQQSERSVEPFRDPRGELHALRDDVAKSYTVIYAKVNALVKQGDEIAVQALSDLAERMRRLASDFGHPSNVAVLPRPEVSSGRPTLKKAELYTRAQIRKQMKKKAQTTEEIHVDPEDILFCSLCFEEHPALPEDMDPEEPDARETQWMRCTQCRVWAHAVCARAIQNRRCKACKTGKYSIYV
ncbi:MULE domain-containing protein [Trichostrongylus colubriformis]|uniref:MULE domain-containing protein n=1 Tax=Trichostrongylus colubriformis TaxID=6319 RepID=A0AAN8GAP3_TRICO